MNMHGVPSYYCSHVNSTTLELRSGSIVTIHCKAGSESARLVFETRAKCHDFVADIKMMVSPMKLTVPSAVAKQLSRSANPNHLKTGRSESSLRWQINSKFSSLMEMTKVHLLSQRSTPAHKSSALKIEEIVLENPYSNLLLLEVDSCLPLLHLTCVFLVFLVNCCNGSSLRPSRPMCDGRPFVSPLFRRLAGRGALFRGFPSRWVPHFVLSLTRCLTVHDATSCSMEDSLFEFERPYDNLSSLYFTALWLQRSLSITFMTQENQPAKEVDLTCFKTFPIKATPCIQVDHVPGLATGSDCKIRSIQTFLLT